MAGFAHDFGHGGLVICNLFAYRATDPAALLTAPDPVGPFNDAEIAVACTHRRVVVAWGAAPQHKKRIDKVLWILRNFAASVECLGLTKEGFPRHPLYVPAATKPIPFGG